jgi:tetratricopeptide (TPR) repeat protein
VIQPGDVRRRIIPRWRSVDDAIDPSVGREHAPDLRELRDDVIAREHAWLAADRQSRGLALDLVAAAATAPDPSLAAKEAAQWLIDSGPVSALMRRVATSLLGPPGHQPELDLPSTDDPAESKSVFKRVKYLRIALQTDPRNALAWAEQARMYTLIGQAEPAKRAMAKAVDLAPHHRFLLRAASRLSLHLDEPDHAHAVLLSSPRTLSDPWLMASEIAVASFSSQPSRQIVSARNLVAQGSWTRRDLTELASAVGTIELEAGKERRARNLFRTSLDDPNENSLAQAEWAAPKVAGMQSRLKPAMSSTPRSFEAHSRAAAAAADHPKAVEQGWLWLLDQPFSTQPAWFGSYHAALTRDFQRSFEFAKRGLQANPGDVTLLNNAAFALALADKPDNAASYIAEVKNIDGLAPAQQAMIVATQGLIAFRSRQPALGKMLYMHAIDIATDAATETLATIMLASELARLRAPGYEEALRRAAEQCKRHLRQQDQAWLGYLQP